MSFSPLYTSSSQPVGLGPFGSGMTFHRGCISEMCIMIHNSSKILMKADRFHIRIMKTPSLLSSSKYPVSDFMAR